MKLFVTTKKENQSDHNLRVIFVVRRSRNTIAQMSNNHNRRERSSRTARPSPASAGHSGGHPSSRTRRAHNRDAYHHHQMQRLHQDDEFSFISPCVKYSLFFFNLLFWVCMIEMESLMSPELMHMTSRIVCSSWEECW